MNMLNEMYKKLKLKVKPEMLIAIAVVIMIGIIFASTIGNTNKTKNTDNQQTNSINISESNSESMEERLASTLSGIKGAGKVRVMVTYETGTEIVPVLSTDKEVSTVVDSGTNQSRKSETIREKTSPFTVQEQGDSTAMVLTEKNPQVRGVIVISEGAGQIDVKVKLLQAVQTVLDITADRVDVFEMN